MLTRNSASNAGSGTTRPSRPSLLTPKPSCPCNGEFVLLEEQPSLAGEVEQWLRNHAKHHGNRKPEPDGSRGEELRQDYGRTVRERLLEEHQHDDANVVVGGDGT